MSVGRRDFLRLVAGLGATQSISLASTSRLFAQSLPTEITSMTASQLSVAIRSREVSCVEVMNAYLDRIHRVNPVYNVIVSMVEDDLLIDQARFADQALSKDEYWGWMHGMPHAVKDLANARGLETSYGSPLFAGTIAEADDIHVSRIRGQGAIFIGKTNVPEFGLGSQSYNTVHGTTKNAYNPALTSGGSSGGAASGMALQVLPTADGSDMMGSLRNPAGFNNVVGFRPSQGRVPATPGDLFYHQLSVNGPMGRNVEDTIRLLHTIAGFDFRSPLSLKDAVPDYEAFRKSHLLDYRIGWMGNYEGYLATEPGVLQVCEQALRRLDQFGVIVEDCQPEYDMARLWQTWLTFRHWSQTGRQEQYNDPQIRRQFKPELVWEIEGSFDITGERLSGAAVDRADWYRALLSLFLDYDILALPSAQVFPFDAEIHWPRSINGRTMDTYHRWMEVVIGGTLAGLPVVSLPAGFDNEGRPMGIQFIGKMGQDKEVLEFAMAYDAVTEYLQVRPEVQV
ncbi:MAG: amidase [Gammaproteobacteria bacterium]|nr:amidase [Gammaproteobacteria bacterium]